MARCKECGIQQIQCGEHWDAEMTVWTGEWPGDVECRELGLWVSHASVMRPPIRKTTADDPDRTEDLNELHLRFAMGEIGWDRETERFVSR